MLAIYKKELKSYFTSVLGWLFAGILMFVIGIYFVVYNLTYTYAQFGYALSGAYFVFLIIVPILTMKIMADERRLKTDQILFTSPVNIFDVILGKYLALLTVFAIPVVISCFYPLIIKQYGTVNLKMAFVAIIGFALLGATAIAIGVFISSITESQVIAAVLGFGVLFLMFMVNGIITLLSNSAISSFIAIIIMVIIIGSILYFMTQNYVLAISVSIIGGVICLILYLVDSSKFVGKLSDILSGINLVDKFSNFASGIFDVTGLIYYLSLIGLFLFLTVQAIQKRRWS